MGCTWTTAPHILLRQPGELALIRMVLEADPRETVDALHAQVLAHGLKKVDPPGKLRQPHGDYGFGFKDPEGRNIAIVCGVRDNADAADMPDRPRKLTQSTSMPATATQRSPATATRSASRSPTHRAAAFPVYHHSWCWLTGGPTLNHIAFEMPDLDSVMRGAGRMRDDGRGIEWGPGRHGPGNNVFCYFRPEAMPGALTAEMQQIDANAPISPPSLLLA